MPTSSKKYNLNTTNNQSCFYVDGLVTPISEFQLTSLLNRLLSVNFALNPPFKVNLKNNIIDVPYFGYYTDDEDINYIILKNSTELRPLFKNLQHIDFFLIIHTFKLIATGTVTDKLKHAPDIQTVISIDTKKLNWLKQIPMQF